MPELGALIKQPDLAATLGGDRRARRQGILCGTGGRGSGGRRARGRRHLDARRTSPRTGWSSANPLVGEYHGARIVSASPPSSGGVALLDALNILSGFDLKVVDSATRKHSSSRRCTAPTATARSTWAIRISSPCRSRSSRAKTTRPASAPAFAPTRRCRATCCRASRPRPSGMDTTHFSVLDAQRQSRGGHASPSICFSARATWSRRPACCSTTPWTISRSSRARRTPSDWSATRRTPSRRTSVRCPA